ncbi:hypothetical protein GDO78_017853 [Eleutherodactylus coqui]|uniref:Uncharacterized protein n=1 Tax=Eleutherodactylus coqui TaxID=57060 RepID=A0A8J6BQM2_ELECQ|nr:hypothetical protein GDO78_017853 [Eleutherodactylus coqui]
MSPDGGGSHDFFLIESDFLCSGVMLGVVVQSPRLVNSFPSVLSHGPLTDSRCALVGPLISLAPDHLCLGRRGADWSHDLSDSLWRRATRNDGKNLV